MRPLFVRCSNPSGLWPPFRFRLPVHFMTHSEMGREDAIIREWLDCRVTESGILVAIQRLLPRPPLQRHLLDEWMNHYR